MLTIQKGFIVLLPYINVLWSNLPSLFLLSLLPPTLTVLNGTGWMYSTYVCLIFFFFLWYWGLNSGPHSCLAGPLPLEPLCLPCAMFIFIVETRPVGFYRGKKKCPSCEMHFITSYQAPTSLVMWIFIPLLMWCLPVLSPVNLLFFSSLLYL
jgi:hypothetical protein